MTNSRNAVAYHSRLAQNWDSRYRAGSFQRRAQLFSKRLLPLVPAGGRWLDVGCGSGYFSRVLALAKATVVGLDASGPMLEEASALARKAGLADRVCFELVATVERIPFDDGTFDGCIALSLIEYLPNPGGCLDEMARVLKPGGHMIVSIPHRRSVVREVQRLFRSVGGSEGTSLDYLSSSLNATTPRDMSHALRSRGMILIQTKGFDPIIPETMHAVLPPSLIYFVARKA